MGNLYARLQEIIGEKIFRHKVTFDGDVVFKKHITAYAPVPGEPSLGTGHFFPRTNTTSRLIINALAAPAVAAWSAAITAQGPVGIKEILVDIIVDIDPTAAGATLSDIHFSDNNTTVPAYTTAHPFVTCKYTAAGAADYHRFNKELHIPVNSSQQFYIYCSAAINIQTATIYATQKKYFI